MWLTPYAHDFISGRCRIAWVRVLLSALLLYPRFQSKSLATVSFDSGKNVTARICSWLKKVAHDFLGTWSGDQMIAWGYASFEMSFYFFLYKPRFSPCGQTFTLGLKVSFVYMLTISIWCWTLFFPILWRIELGLNVILVKSLQQSILGCVLIVFTRSLQVQSELICVIV